MQTTYSNYYPFGMAQPGRNWSSGGYRFGYKGKIKRSFNKYKNQI